MGEEGTGTYGGGGVLAPSPPVRAAKVNGRPGLDHSTAPFARNGPVQETQPDPQREPNDCSQKTEEAELGLLNVRTLLQAHHFRVLGR
jgi:hypothetical protein